MSSINTVLDIAKNALQANQKAINVTSHNIANANTPGYSRQKVDFSTNEPLRVGDQYFGTGVSIESVRRVYDSFQALQLRSAESKLSGFEAKNEHVSSLERVINELGEGGLSGLLDDFFNGFQDIAADPSSYTARSAMLSTAATLADRFNSIDDSIRTTLRTMNEQVADRVDRINSIASEVADLNAKIGSTTNSGGSVNDLLDKRDAALDELAGIIDITTYENDDGKVDVLLGGGITLVAGVYSSTVATAAGDDPYMDDITLGGVVLNDKITSGSVRGTLDAAAYFQGFQDKLDRFATSLVKEVNVLHGSGYGLDGSTGQDFFTASTVTTTARASNTGGALVASATVADQSAITLDDYEIRFSSPSSYNIVNSRTGAITTSGAYTSGSAITFDGLSVTVSDDTGAPAAGDTFTVSVTANAANNLSVALTDANKIAASSTAAGVPGDNSNSLALAGLRDSSTIEGTTFREYYAGMVTDLGIESSESSSRMKAQSSVVNQFTIAKESVSGVSIEEEAVELMKLQSAFEAAAKVLKTANEMYDVILALG